MGLSEETSFTKAPSLSLLAPVPPELWCCRLGAINAPFILTRRVIGSYATQVTWPHWLVMTLAKHPDAVGPATAFSSIFKLLPYLIVILDGFEELALSSCD